MLAETRAEPRSGPMTSPLRDGGGAVGTAVQRRGAGRGGAGLAARDLAAGGSNPEKGVGGPGPADS